MTVMTPQELSKLVVYKYCGSDSSWTYKYLLSPWAEFWVGYMPTTVAPNLITLSGLIFSLITFFSTVIYNPTFGPDGPRWIAAMTAVNLFIYQTLDNMDGKQARKTGTSSPLGMLFDHGIDAINSSLLMLPLASALGVGSSMSIWWFYLTGWPAFYMQTLEEYYREAMVLPFINGPTEGILFTCALCLYSSFYGPEHLHEANATPDCLLSVMPFLPETYKGFDLVILFFIVSLVTTLAINISTACAKSVEVQGKSYWAPFYTMLPFIIFFTGGFCYCMVSNIAMEKHPLLVTILLGSVMVEITTHVMLMHICHSPLRPNERYLVWLPVLLAANLAFSENPLGIVDEVTLLVTFAGVAFMYTSHRFISVCFESAEALDIYILTQGRPSEATGKSD